MDDDSDSDVDQMYIKTFGMDINSISRTDDVIKKKLQVNDVSLEMNLDTEAAVSVLPERMFNTKFPKLKIQPSDIVLKTYTGERLKPVGVGKVSVKYQNQCKNLKLYVVKNTGVTLFSRDWLKHITLNWLEIKTAVISKTQGNLNTLLEKHSSVFKEDWGTLTGIKAKLTLKPDTTPTFVKARHVQ